MLRTQPRQIARATGARVYGIWGSVLLSLAVLPLVSDPCDPCIPCF